MPQSYSQLRNRLEALQAEAATLRRREASRVISRIKLAIATYALTAADLFGRSVGADVGARSTAARVKYADHNGNTWVGRGKRPQWLRDAIDAGHALEEFAVGRISVAVSSVRRGKRASARAAQRAAERTSRQRKGAGIVKYRDNAGNEWTGFGPKPRWLKDGLAAGKSLESFRV